MISNIFLFIYASVSFIAASKTDLKNTYPSTNTRNVQDLPYKKAEQQPFMVSVQSLSGMHLCDGVIITQKLVLTVASCIARKSPKLIKLAVGSEYLNKGQVYTVKKMAVHWAYSSFYMRNDIGVIQVEPPFLLNDKVNIVDIEPKNETVEPGTDMVIFSWNKDMEDFQNSEFLHEMNVKILSFKECVEAGNENIIEEVHVCATNHNNNYGACLAEAGAPLMYKHKLFGIHLPASSCLFYGNSRGNPAVFMRIPFFNSWIETIIVEANRGTIRSKSETATDEDVIEIL